MSAPFRTFERSIPLEGMDTSDSIALGRIMSDDEIIAGFESQFDPSVISGAVEVAHARLHAGIDAAYPDVSHDNQEHINQISRSGKTEPGYYEHMDSTMPPDVAEVAAEPEVTYADKLRDYTPEEAAVVLAALRTAVSNPAYKLEATSILAERSPSKVERYTRQTALRLGRIPAAVKTARPYHGRHRA